MRREYNFYVYILASESGTLYVGFTNNIYRRVLEHKERKISGFTQKYACKKLVYYEEYQYAREAIVREKQLKGWTRKKKEKLISSFNPHWEDLYNELND